MFNLHGYQWKDDEWQQRKMEEASYDKPMNIYEVHLGSWRRKEGQKYLSYVDLAEQLVDYVAEMGYTHVEFLPIVEHPYDGSWGYQATGYFAATSRYGNPHELMYLIDRLHQRGIGVILDWVPGHFCKDDHGLRLFDGTPTYEYDDLLRQENFGWGTSNFDLGRTEVQSFLISNAIFWLDVFHFDGIRVDAVASLLYLDYDRGEGWWRPNSFGGKENLEGIAFLRKLNEVVFSYFPNALMMAEESTAWALVTKPTYVGGLGFNYKWNMGWMNDTLKYIEKDPVHRKYHHNSLTFSLMYAFSENFVLPFSHDEVVHGKRSMLDKMPGDYWQKFANLRALYGYMMAHPGKKLLFMGGEFGHFIEWNFDQSLDWHLLDYEMHHKMQLYVKELNHFYLERECLWQKDFTWEGFEWIDPHDGDNSVVSFIRRGKDPDKFLIAVSNFTPVVRHHYKIGVPKPGWYQEIFNSDHLLYGGSGVSNLATLRTLGHPWHNQEDCIEVILPPLATIFIEKVKPSIKNPYDKQFDL